VYINSTASGVSDIKALRLTDFPPESQTLSLCGRVTREGCGQPVSGVTVALSGQVETTTDGDGYFEIIGATLMKPAGIPPGTIIVTAVAENYRTKMIRLTVEGVSRRPATPARNRAGVRCPRIDFQVSAIPAPPDDQRDYTQVIDAADAAVGMITDEDRDGIDDACEDWLAERFAPILHHGDRETNYPVSVDWWLARTDLSLIDSEGNRRRKVSAPIPQSQLIEQSLTSGNVDDLSSSETRSRVKEVTFYLENVAPQFREGQKNEPSAWITYVHSFGNELGGVTIQYIGAAIAGIRRHSWVLTSVMGVTGKASPSTLTRT